MPKIEQVKNIEWDHIAHVAEHVRDIEAADYLRHYDTVAEGIMHGLAESDEPRCTLLDGEPVAIFGVAPNLAEGEFLPWLVLTKEATKHPVLVMRHAKKWFDGAARKYKKMSNHVPAEDDLAIRFIETLGFNINTDEEIEIAGAAYHRFWYDEETQ